MIKHRNKECNSMNCLWLLILLFCSQNSCGQNTQSNNICGNITGDCGCDLRNERDNCRRRDNDCECNRRHRSDCNCDCERRHENDCDSDCDNDRNFDRRGFIPFGNQTCGCENNQCQS